MSSLPTDYTAKVVIPLPTDDELVPANREKLALANDLNVARMLAGTDDMFDSTIGIVRAVFQAKDVDVKVRELTLLREVEDGERARSCESSRSMSFVSHCVASI
jgi:hypothetical protein